MKPPFSYEKRETTGPYKFEYRVADASDDRIATCWDEENARELVGRLNAGSAAPELLAALERIVAAWHAGGSDEGFVYEMGGSDFVQRVEPLIAKAKGGAG